MKIVPHLDDVTLRPGHMISLFNAFMGLKELSDPAVEMGGESSSSAISSDEMESLLAKITALENRIGLTGESLVIHSAIQ